MKQTVLQTRTATRRGGVVLISVLVCLAVVMMLFASWLRVCAAERDQVRAQQNRVQAELLADAALERAVAQLATRDDYQGETWNLDAASFGGRAAARVEIRVTRTTGEPSKCQVHVTADFPAEGVAQARRSKEITRIPKTTGGGS